MRKAVNYLSNKSLLEQIWLSKLSFCEVFDEEFTVPDVIVGDLTEVTEAGKTIRLVTENHVPLAEIAGKGKLGHLDRVTFAPFSLFRSEIDEDGVLTYRETARSHYKEGVFNPTYGNITTTLGTQMMKMVERYAMKGSWRNYSYIDDMKSEALIALLKNGLKFDEDQTTPNPFAYFTQIVHNSFIRQWKQEKAQQDIRDDLLQDAGANPSITRQIRT